MNRGLMVTVTFLAAFVMTAAAVAGDLDPTAPFFPPEFFTAMK